MNKHIEVLLQDLGALKKEVTRETDYLLLALDILLAKGEQIDKPFYVEIFTKGLLELEKKKKLLQKLYSENKIEFDPEISEGQENRAEVIQESSEEDSMRYDNTDIIIDVDHRHVNGENSFKESDVSDENEKESDANEAKKIEDIQNEVLQQFQNMSYGGKISYVKTLSNQLLIKLFTIESRIENLLKGFTEQVTERISQVDQTYSSSPELLEILTGMFKLILDFTLETKKLILEHGRFFDKLDQSSNLIEIGEAYNAGYYKLSPMILSDILLDAHIKLATSEQEIELGASKIKEEQLIWLGYMYNIVSAELKDVSGSMMSQYALTNIYIGMPLNKQALDDSAKEPTDEALDGIYIKESCNKQALDDREKGATDESLDSIFNKILLFLKKIYFSAQEYYVYIYNFFFSKNLDADDIENQDISKEEEFFNDISDESTESGGETENSYEWE